MEETLEKNFKTKLLASDVKINLGEEVYRQPDIEESGEMKQKVKKLNSLLKKYRSTTVTYLFGEETQVLESDTISSWLQIKNSGISLIRMRWQTTYRIWRTNIIRFMFHVPFIHRWEQM